MLKTEDICEILKQVGEEKWRNHKIQGYLKLIIRYDLFFQYFPFYFWRANTNKHDKKESEGKCLILRTELSV